MAEVCVPSRRGRRGCRALPLPRLPPVGGAGQGCRASGVGPRASIRVKKPGTPSPGVLPKRGCQSVIQEQAADTSWSLQVNGFLSAPGGSRGPRDALPPTPAQRPVAGEQPAFHTACEAGTRAWETLTSPLSFWGRECGWGRLPRASRRAPGPGPALRESSPCGSVQRVQRRLHRIRPRPFPTPAAGTPA